MLPVDPNFSRLNKYLFVSENFVLSFGFPDRSNPNLADFFAIDDKETNA